MKRANAQSIHWAHWVLAQLVYVLLAGHKRYLWPASIQTKTLFYHKYVWTHLSSQNCLIYIQINNFLLILPLRPISTILDQFLNYFLAELATKLQIQKKMLKWWIEGLSNVNKTLYSMVRTQTNRVSCNSSWQNILWSTWTSQVSDIPLFWSTCGPVEFKGWNFC